MTGEPAAKPMTPEDVIRRIATECAHVDKNGAVGIRLEPAAALSVDTASNAAKQHCPRPNLLAVPADPDPPGSKRRYCRCSTAPLNFQSRMDQRVEDTIRSSPASLSLKYSLLTPVTS
jgi:hypothetical protein